MNTGKLYQRVKKLYEEEKTKGWGEHNIQPLPGVIKYPLFVVQTADLRPQSFGLRICIYSTNMCNCG